MTVPRWFLLTMTACAIVIAASLVMLATRPQVGRYVELRETKRLLDTATGTLCLSHAKESAALRRESSCGG